MTYFKMTLGAAALLMAGLPAQAEGPALLEQMQASRVMYDAGVEARDPLLVLAAAKMRKSLDPQPQEGASGDGPLLADDMLATARKLATGDDLMLGLIEDVAVETTKGVVIGPVYNIARLGARATDRYADVPFAGGEYAEIYVEARGNADLNLRIFDSRNRLVCSDTDSSAIAYCGWRPRSEGNFTIAVENASASAVDYSMITN
ncbi:MAG: hypothetical protein AAF714_05010 [Pseudomonadota bacterium]